MGGVFCQFEDPDGNTFVLAGFDDATRQIEAGRRAYAEHLEAKRRTEQELAIAKEVQFRLSPQHKPDLPMLDYAGVCIQALAVGGDYYDFLELSDNCVALVVGDISGKGIAAALLMANLQANLRSQHLFAGCRRINCSIRLIECCFKTPRLLPTQLCSLHNLIEIPRSYDMQTAVMCLPFSSAPMATWNACRRPVRFSVCLRTGTA